MAGKLCETLGLNEGARNARLSFLDLDASSREALGALAERLDPLLEEIVDRWHAFLLQRPETEPLLDAPGRGAHLKEVQCRYFRTLLTGPFDENWFERRLRVGLAHERVALDPAWYLGSYRKFIDLVREALSARGVEPATLTRWLAVLEKVVYLDMELALDAYFHAKNQAIVASNKTLRALADELTRTARVKEEFLSRVGHELRTPLNAVLGYADLLVDEIDGPLNEEQAASARKIHDRGQRLLHLIDGLIDATRMAAAGVRELTPFDPRPLVERLAERAGTMAEARGLSFRLELADALPNVAGDEEPFAAALWHVLDNAVKFTGEGGVRLAVEEVDDGVGFTVTDTGPGIPAEEHQRVFDAFHQVHGGDDRPFEGLGMGLTLAAHALAAMGGRLELLEPEVAGKNEGEGSSFLLWLPRA